MIEDIGMREGATIDNVNSESVWIYGYPWIKLEVSEFPMQIIDDVKLKQQEVTPIKTETQTKLINSIIITYNSNITETSTYFTQLKLDT